MPDSPITCEVRYRIDQSRLAEFTAYAEVWIRLIERYGGTHHGYFLPRETPAEAALSFPATGGDASGDTAVALFTFSDEAAYLTYRRRVAEDPDAIAANARFGRDPPFRSYERTFLQPLPRSD